MVVAVGIYRLQERSGNEAHAELMDQLEVQNELLNDFAEREAEVAEEQRAPEPPKPHEVHRHEPHIWSLQDPQHAAHFSSHVRGGFRVLSTKKRRSFCTCRVPVLEDPKSTSQFRRVVAEAYSQAQSHVMGGAGSLVQFARPDLVARIEKARRRILLASPFITGGVAKVIAEAAERSRARERWLITELVERSVRSRVLDPKGLSRLAQAGFTVASLEHLHAKVSIVDNWLKLSATFRPMTESASM